MNNPLSILVLTTSFPTQNSAAGIFVWDECVALSENGVAVTIVAPHCAGAPTTEIRNGIKIVRFRYFFPEKFQCVAYGNGIPINLKNSLLAKMQLPFFAFAFLMAAFKQAKGKQIIHCHWFIAGLIGVVLKKIRSKKLVLMMHHAHSPNRVFNYILKNTDYLLCNSSFVEKKTLTIFPAKKHALIPVTINTNIFIPDVKHKHENEKFQLISVGRFIPLKGFRFLIEAMHILVKERKVENIELKIVGDGILMQKLNQQVKELGLQKHVFFLGSVDHKKLPRHFNAADVFIIPSIVDDNGDTEGLGLVTLEAAACKLPLIGTNVGGIPDIIENNVNGILVEQKNALQLADAIERLKLDSPLREKFGAAALQLTKSRFSRKTITQNILKIYRQVSGNNMNT